MDINFESERHSRRLPPLYAPSGGTRAVRVVIDETALASGTRELDAVQSLLERLAKADSVQVWRYADEGPPRLAKRVRVPHIGTAVEGWLTVEAVAGAKQQMTSHRVLFATGDQVTAAAITGDVGRADRLRGDRSYSELSESEAIQQRGADSVAYGAALAVKADLLVTTRPFLLTGKWFSGLGTVCARPLDAVALLGQILRSRRQYLVRSPFAATSSVLTGKGTFHWIAARALMPAGWEWQEACFDADAKGVADTGVLALSAFQRLARTLVARDQMRWLSYLPQRDDVVEDLMAEMDVLLINLVGAYDAVARVSHRLLSFPPEEEHRVGWQRRDWLKKVRLASPRLAAIIEPSTADREFFDVLRLLRNTIHGVPLQPLGRSTLGGQAAPGTALRLPNDDAAAIVEILERRSWASALGLEDWERAGVLVSPLKLAEHAIPSAAATLNKLMAVRLTVAPSSTGDRPERTAFRADQAHQFFSEENQLDALLQFGLADAHALVTASVRSPAE